ncbi:hypothetical protein T484DRAFT_1823718, partial [Baffinella frigidus]
ALAAALEAANARPYQPGVPRCLKKVVADSSEWFTTKTNRLEKRDRQCIAVDASEWFTTKKSRLEKRDRQSVEEEIIWIYFSKLAADLAAVEAHIPADRAAEEAHIPVLSLAEHVSEMHLEETGSKRLADFATLDLFAKTGSKRLADFATLDLFAKVEELIPRSKCATLFARLSGIVSHDPSPAQPPVSSTTYYILFEDPF